MFLRGQPDLVNRIPRVAVKGAGPRRPGSVDAEPNFYALPYIHDTMARVAHGVVVAPPAEATTREELRIAMARATPNVSARLGGGGGGGAQHGGDLLTACLQNARAASHAVASMAAAANLPAVDAPWPHGSLSAGSRIPIPAETVNVMNTLSLDAAVLARRRQQLLDQDRILASLIPTRSMDRLPNGIDLTALLQVQNPHTPHLGLLGQALAPPPHTTPSPNLDLILLNDLLRRGL
jgi:hypothetical protein